MWNSDLSTNRESSHSLIRKIFKHHHDHLKKVSSHMLEILQDETLAKEEEFVLICSLIRVT